MRQREFDNIAVRNQVFLRVTLAYSELLRSEGRRAVALQAREEAQAIAKLTAVYAETGQGRYADANRAATDLQRREAYLKQVESELLTSSARLCQLLNLDPSIRLHPTDAYVVPHPLVPDPIAVGELIALGLLRRPEVAAQRASVIQGLLVLDEAKALPFSPTIYLGFSAGGFGGGSNLVRPIFGGFGGRSDFDAMAYWTIQNLGVGNVALIRGANANLQVRRFEQIEMLNRVRAEVAEAYARTHARYAQIETNEAAIQSGLLSFTQDLDRIRYRSHDVLPIELLNSFSLMANARIDYIDAIVDYNRAQFELYVALGQPPANALARPGPHPGGRPQRRLRSQSQSFKTTRQVRLLAVPTGVEFPAYKVLRRGQPMHASDEAMRLPARNCIVQSDGPPVRQHRHSLLRLRDRAILGNESNRAFACDREPASVA